MLMIASQTGSTMQQRSRAKADELRKAGHFDEAAKEYAALWPDDDPWTGWGYAYCLRKLNRAREALEIAAAVHELNPEFRFGRSIYAWALYDVHIRGAEDPTPEVLKAALTIVQLASSDERAYATTNPLVITVLRVAKAFDSHGRDAAALEWLDKVDPALLSTTAQKRSDETGREQELASFRERYYSIRSRAFERLGRWQECLETAKRALAECTPVHHDNDVWFARRIALAKRRLGQMEEALAELQQLAVRKPVGFLHTDIAAAAWDDGNAEATFNHALQALMSPGDIGYKVDAARLLAEALWQRGDGDNARSHLRLCIAVRQSKGWKPNEKLAALAKIWGVGQVEDEMNGLLRELQKVWKRWTDDLFPRRTGTVVKMFPHGGAGFIRAEQNEQFYFDARRDWKERAAKPSEGAQVTFTTRQSFDRKRQRATIVACEVRIAPSPP